VSTKIVDIQSSVHDVFQEYIMSLFQSEVLNMHNKTWIFRISKSVRNVFAMVIDKSTWVRSRLFSRFVLLDP